MYVLVVRTLARLNMFLLQLGVSLDYEVADKKRRRSEGTKRIASHYANRLLLKPEQPTHSR